MGIKNELGKKIKIMRNNKGYTQEKLAEMANISQRALSSIELGENFATAETIEKIKNALSVEFVDLFTFEETSKRDTLKAFKLKLEELNEIDKEYFLNNINVYIIMKKK